MDFIQRYHCNEVEKTKNLGRNNYQKSDIASSEAIFNWVESEVAKP